MKNKTFLTILALVVLCFAPACSDDSGPNKDAAEDTMPDPAEPDPVPDPDVTDTPAEVEDPVEVEQDVLPVQDPITFIVRNTSTDTLYLNWQTLGSGLIDGARTGGADWSPVYYWPPFCMAYCEDFEPGGPCCMACMPPPAVKELPADDEVAYTWNGENVHIIDGDYCMCSCYRAVEPTPMNYRASACVYHAFTCWEEPCEPDADGIYHYSNVEGDASCFDVEFEILCEESEIVIEVE